MPVLHTLPRQTVQGRLKRLREALGAEQSELARLFGVDQPQIWRWENDPANPKSLQGAKDRYEALFARLSSDEFLYYHYPREEVPGHPDGREFLAGAYFRTRRGSAYYGHMPEMYSPFWSMRTDLLEIHTTLWEGSDEDWDSLTQQPMFLSRAPWRDSELLRLRAQGALGPIGWDIPAPAGAISAAIEHDVTLHGLPFVAAILEEQASELLEEQALENLTARSDARFGSELLGRLFAPDLPAVLATWDDPRVEVTRSFALDLFREVLGQCKRVDGSWDTDSLGLVLDSLETRRETAGDDLHAPSRRAFLYYRALFERALRSTNGGGDGKADQAD